MAQAAHRGSIRRRILFLVLAFTLATALIMAANSAQAVAESSERAALQSAEFTLQTASTAIRANISEVDGLINWCASDPSTRTWLLTAQGSASLNQTVYTTVSGKYNSMRTAPYLQRFLCVGGNGAVLQFGTASAQSRPLTAAALVALPGFGDAGDVAWQSIVTDPLMLPNMAQPGIPVTRTMSSSGLTAHVYIAASTALITDPLRDLALPEGGALYWVMGNMPYAVAGTALTPVQAVEKDAFTAVEGETLDPATRLYAGRQGASGILAVSYPLGVHDLHLVETFPNTTVADLFPLLLRTVGISLLFIVLLGVILGVLMQYMVARPVHALQRQIERLSAGDLTPDPTLTWNNELGDIGRGINRMTGNINALMEKRLEDEKQKQDLEYRMLQNQINPHFIYNTLNGIKWMATIQHADGIAEMTTALSRLLKSVSKGNERLVPLYEEFALLNDYFTIQQYRYGGTITLEVTHIEDERLAQFCLIPRFTLQPLVENAIFHGIEPSGHAGEITITVTREGGDVLLRLHDNGVGMTPEQAAKALQEPGPEEAAAKFRHVGIWNVHRRLQYSFGEAYGLAIESAPGAGTTVIVRLPGATLDGDAAAQPKENQP